MKLTIARKSDHSTSMQVIEGGKGGTIGTAIEIDTANAVIALVFDEGG